MGGSLGATVWNNILGNELSWKACLIKRSEGSWGIGTMWTALEKWSTTVVLPFFKEEVKSHNPELCGTKVGEEWTGEAVGCLELDVKPCYKLRQRELQLKSQEWSRTTRSVAGAERVDLKHAWKCVLSWAVHLFSGAMVHLDFSAHAEASAWSPTGRSSRLEGWPLPKPSPAGKTGMARVGSGLTFQVLGWYERINQNLSRNIGRIGSYGQSRL